MDFVIWASLSSPIGLSQYFGAWPFLKRVAHSASIVVIGCNDISFIPTEIGSLTSLGYLALGKFIICSRFDSVSLMIFVK